MGRRRGLVVLLAFVMVATACVSGDESADTTTEARVSSSDQTSGSTTIPADPGQDINLRAVFESNGITVIDAPEDVGEVTSLQLWSFQVDNMEQEIVERTGIIGTELDRAAGAPSGMPFSYLIAGWITSAGTDAAAAAAEIMGDQPYEYAPSLIYPNAVIVLFVADSLLADGLIGADGGSARMVQADGLRFDVSVGTAEPTALAQSGPCTRLSEWFKGAMDWVFEGLKFESVSDAWYGWAQRVWNGAVDLARAAVETGVRVVTEAVLAPIRKALAIGYTVNMVVTHLQPWSADIRPARSTTELAVGDEPDVVEVASVFVSTGIRDPWPDLLENCASVAGLKLPDPTSTAGSKVEWDLVDAFPKNRASIIDAGETVRSDNHAVMRWTPGRDEGEQPFPGWIHLTVTIEKNQVDQLQDMLVEFVGVKVFGAGYTKAVEDAVETLTAPVWEALFEILEVTDRQRINVIHHEDIEFEYPIDDLETHEADGLIRIDIERASRTIENIVAGGNIDVGPITGHPDFAVTLAPSDPECRLQNGLPFTENDEDCAFTVVEGPDFLVDAVLVSAEINGTRYYEWFGTEDAAEMFAFVGAADLPRPDLDHSWQPRCLDLAWYFRIFETGVMLGYPQGLTQLERIDQSGPDCVALLMSNTNEYVTNP